MVFNLIFYSIGLNLSSMLIILTISLINFSLNFCQELSVKLIIEKRSDLSTIVGDRYLPNTDVMVYMGNVNLRNMIFFAPHNLAFSLSSFELQTQLNLALKATINQIFQYHLVPSILNTSWTPGSMVEGQQVKLLTQYGTSYIFATKINGFVFVNGARILVPSLTAGNGMVHIIDKIFANVGSRGPVSISQSGQNAFDYIRKNDRTTEIGFLFSKFKELETSNTAFANQKYGVVMDTIVSNSLISCTIFVPYNLYLERMKLGNKDLYNQIGGASPAIAKQAMESLIVPNIAYHMSLLEELTTNKSTVEAVIGQIKVYRIDEKIYVSNQCGTASLIEGDLTTINCVVHVIDRLLNLVSNDLFTEITTRTDLQAFSRNLAIADNSDVVRKLKLVGGVEYVVPDNEKYTVFAPNDVVYNYIDMSTNFDELVQQLSMVIASGVIDLSEVVGQIKVDTLRPGYKATITKIGQSFYVEVNYVRAKITAGNICTRNGMLHKVDRIVGLRDGTIGNYLSRMDEFRRLNVIIQDTGLQTQCINQYVQLTLFAPNQSAVANLGQGFQGQQNKNKLTWLMKTHLGKDVLFLDSIPDGGSKVLETYNGLVVVYNTGGEYRVSIGEQRVKVLQANIGASNGVIHIIETFLPYVVGMSPSLSPLSTLVGLFLVILSLCFSFI